MEKMQLLKKLETMLDNAQATRQWGKIEITLQDGEVSVINESRTTKFRKEGNTHDRSEYR
jgi:hypothetical protein